MQPIPKHRRLLGDAIRQSRKKAYLTQEKLAELAGLHHNYIGEVERGEKAVSIDCLVQIANALKVSTSSLVKNL